MWTLFWDMHSGGSLKEKWALIYIEAPVEEAMAIFYNRFGHNPERVSCTCCGEDYSINESEDLAQASGYHRGCAYGYINPKGVEVTKKQAKSTSKTRFLKRGYSSQYLERESKEYNYNPYLSLEEYINKEDVLVIFKEVIKDNERVGEVPEEGYVWR